MSEYSKQVYYSSKVSSPEGVRHLVAEVGASQPLVGKLLVGTDFPSPWKTTPVDFISSTPELNQADKIAMLGGTVMALLGIKA